MPANSRMRDMHIPSVSENLALVLASLDDDQAQNIVTIDLEGKSSIAAYMVVASGRSTRHVSAIADHILERLKQAGHKAIHTEGRDNADWILIDIFDVIIHIFRPEVREFYTIEKMWAADLETDTSAPQHG